MSFMQVSRRTDYALRAMIYLSAQESDRSCTTAMIASSQGVPQKFLEKIIQDLIRGGIVKSKRGCEGGYSLARPPREISFRNIIEAVEGPIALNVCLEEQSSCNHFPKCTMYGVWSEVQRRVLDVFTQTSLADLKLKPGEARMSSSSLSSAA